jgi:hypothetical protein
MAPARREIQRICFIVARNNLAATGVEIILSE